MGGPPAPAAGCGSAPESGFRPTNRAVGRRTGRAPAADRRCATAPHGRAFPATAATIGRCRSDAGGLRGRNRRMRLRQDVDETTLGNVQRTETEFFGGTRLDRHPAVHADGMAQEIVPVRRQTEPDIRRPPSRGPIDTGASRASCRGPACGFAGSVDIHLNGCRRRPLAGGKNRAKSRRIEGAAPISACRLRLPRSGRAC